jgi:hypothetical protein
LATRCGIGAIRANSVVLGGAEKGARPEMMRDCARVSSAVPTEPHRPTHVLLLYDEAERVDAGDDAGKAFP